MSWLDRFLPASFRGVAFRVEAHQQKFGRRVVVHEYPHVDAGESEDLGRKPGEFSIEAYLIGPDHDLERDELVRVCEEVSGPGELVHPYLGTRTVVFVDGSLSERSSERRLSRLTLTFREVSPRRNPARRAAPLDAVRSASADLQAAAEQELVEAMVVEGVPEFVRQAAVDALGKAVEAIEELGVFAGAAEDVARTRAQLQALLGSGEDLVEDPRRLAEEIRLTVAALASSAGAGDAGLEGFLELLGFSVEGSGGATPLDRQTDANGAAVANLVRLGAVAGAVELAAQQAWETRDDALEVRDRIAAELDLQAESSKDDSVYLALGGLRSVLTGAVPPPDQDLPELRTLILSDTTPALVLGYELYDDAARGDQIVARNRIRHPGFVPAATPLQVLQVLQDAQ